LVKQEEDKVPSEKRKPLIGAIRECFDKEQLEETFTLFGVTDIQEKAGILIEAMYNPAVFFSSGSMDIEQEYKTLAGAFLSRVWK
jgi:hypothetical protein